MRKGADKLTKFLNAKQQGRLDGFFTVQPKTKVASAAVGKGAKDAKGKGAKGKEKDVKGKRKVRSLFATSWMCIGEGCALLTIL